MYKTDLCNLHEIYIYPLHTQLERARLSDINKEILAYGEFVKQFGLTGTIGYNVKYRNKRIWTLKDLSKVFDQYDSTNSDENTILHLACIEDNIQRVIFCTEVMQMDPNDINIQGKNALHLAVQLGHSSVVHYLVQNTDIPLTEEDIYSPLHFAALYGHFELVEYFVSNVQIDPILCNISEKLTPLHCACVCGSQRIAEFLIKEAKKCQSVQNIINLTTKCGDTLVHYAALSGNVQLVRYLTNNYFMKPDIANAQGTTPLHLAIYTGKLTLVRYLAEECEVNINSRNSDGNTPILFAAMYGHLNIVKYLLKRGCTPLQTNVNGDTPVHLAARNGHIAIVKYLVEECAVEINCKDKETSSFLNAVMNGQLVVVEYLIKHGCNPQERNIYGNGAVHLAVLNNQLPMLKYLKEQLNCDPSAANDKEQMPIHHACVDGNIDIIQYLVEEFAVEINCKDEDGVTPFHIAVMNGHLIVVQYLIKNGCNPPLERNIYGNGVIHLAVLNDHLPVLKYLKEQLNSDPSAANDKGRMPIHHACMDGNIDIIQYLVEECAVEINCKDKGGDTPFLGAVFNGHLVVAKYLIRHGCNPLERDCDGNGGIHLAVLNDHLVVLKYLKEQLNSDPSAANDKGRMPIHHACMDGNIDIIQYLVEECAVEINCKDKDGVTPFSVAVVKGHLVVVEYLIEHGCNPLEQIIYGNGGIHLAALNNQLPVLKYLKEQLNCDPSAANNKRQMPIHYACWEGHIDIIQYLVEECAVEINCKDKDGVTPFSVAVVKGHLVVVEYLIRHGCNPLEQIFCGNGGIHIAVWNNQLTVLKYFKEQLNCDPSAANNEGQMPIHLACQKGNIDIVQYLAKECADLNPCASNKYGCTPLDIATVYHNQEVVEFLQQHTTSTHSPPSVIHLSALLGHISSIQHYIADLQYDPDLRDSIGRTPLHYAAMGGHLIITQYLVSSNADPLSEDVFHNLPLHYAAALGHLDVVQFLVNIGSPLIARGAWDKTSVEMAAAGGHKGVLDYLQQLLPKTGHTVTNTPQDCNNPHEISSKSITIEQSVVPQASKLSSVLPFVKPVEVIQVSSKGGLYLDDSLGLYINVPEGAVPEGSLLHLEIGMCLYGPFRFPKDLYPIAPILMLCPQSDIKLHKSVTITMPHIIADAEDIDSEAHGIQVIKADHSSILQASKSMFNIVLQNSNLSFHIRDGFALASFTLSSFSFVSVFEKRENIGVAKSRGYCICPLLPLPSAISSGTFTFYLCVTYFMRPCLEVRIVTKFYLNLLTEMTVCMNVRV